MKKNLCIVGAGLSGLYLAYMLEDKYNITILEARQRTGGRIYTIDGNDMGPSWIWSHQKKILELMDELGLELFAQYEKGYALFDTVQNVEKFKPQPTSTPARMKGTLSSLINTLNSKLTKTQIKFSQEVLSISETAQGIDIHTTKFSYNFDFVVVTLAPRLAVMLEYKPELDKNLKQKLLDTQTWMGNSAKCVVEFRSCVWKEQGLSGFVFSHNGPLGEIHDASEEKKYALFGFVNSSADMSTLTQDVKQQMIRLFQINSDDILNIYFVDWRSEKYSSVNADLSSNGGHPNYGIDTSLYSKKILFSSTEFSFDNGGYIEGAIIQAQKIAKELKAQLS